MDLIKQTITYHGAISELPVFLSWFLIPVPRAFFQAIFKPYYKNRKRYYRDDHYNFDVGDTVYSHVEAYTRSWETFTDSDSFGVQIRFVEAYHDSRARMTVSIYRYSTSDMSSERKETTQGRFLDFLKSGDVADL